MKKDQIEPFFATLKTANPQPNTELEYTSVFELLADTRAQIETVNAAIEALRDFWLAQAELEMALVGKPGH